MNVLRWLSNYAKHSRPLIHISGPQARRAGVRHAAPAGRPVRVQPAAAAAFAPILPDCHSIAHLGLRQLLARVSS